MAAPGKRAIVGHGKHNLFIFTLPFAFNALVVEFIIACKLPINKIEKVLTNQIKIKFINDIVFLDLNYIYLMIKKYKKFI